MDRSIEALRKRVRWIIWLTGVLTAIPLVSVWFAPTNQKLGLIIWAMLGAIFTSSLIYLYRLTTRK